MSEVDVKKYPGLTPEEVRASRETHGTNEMVSTSPKFWYSIISFFKDPMLLLLITAAVVYYVIGETEDAVFMIAAIGIVSGISIYQERRSKKALESLRQLTSPLCTVVRNGAVTEIRKEEVVIDDTLIVSEGKSIPADATILRCNDFSVNESVLTGESLPVFKSVENNENLVFQGTTVVTGLAICRVTGIGEATKLGKIGLSLASIDYETSPLQQQINRFVRLMAIAGLIIFLVTWLLNYLQSGSATDSLLKALTLAMSVLPEEIPVAFATFMAVGAWRLAKLGIIVKKTNVVETLGSATVICTDKTGTITENVMRLAALYDLSTDKTIPAESVTELEMPIIEMAMWASEPIPFDPMEKALHATYAKVARPDKRSIFKMVHEYPLGGTPPLMTHVFEDSHKERIIACKGAPEALIALSDLSPLDLDNITSAFRDLSRKGYRVLAVGYADHPGEILPADQHDFKVAIMGIVAFYDPPKTNIESVFKTFRGAGIDVKIITGDNAFTTASIARQINFPNADRVIDGDELMKLNDEEISEKVRQISIFTRMFPEAKLKILNALKANGEIVAMTGDGVNDAPALKAAHIGIAMGIKGTEIAKEASSLILSDDDLSRMVSAVAMGRRIYTNLKKAIQYIISIHIPIILIVFLPLLLGWVYPNIFTPVHIIFLELIMGPTCSIIYENEPLEKNAMREKPRKSTNTFFNGRELVTSIIQGLMITAGLVVVYQYGIGAGSTESGVRTMVFIALVVANICLTLVNRSFFYSIIHTIRYRNRLMLVIILVTIMLTIILLTVPFLKDLFEFTTVSLNALAFSISLGVASVVWFEGVKWFTRNRAGKAEYSIRREDAT